LIIEFDQLPQISHNRGIDDLPGFNAMKFRFLTAVALTGLAACIGQAKADDQFDLAIEAIVSSDGMDTGLTYTDHKPAVSISITPSYGIFYATLFGERIDYGAGDPRWATVKGSIGATPVFGPLSVDFNLQRRGKLGAIDESATRWLPYVTATYTVNEQLSGSLGAGYYAYDDASLTKSYWELYGAIDATPVDGLKLHAEASYDPKSDLGDNDYLELIGSATITLPKNFEVYGKIGYEDYIQGQLATYTWYEAGINYNVNEHVVLGLKGQANNLAAGADCDGQKWTDCNNAVFATITLNGKASDLHK
jgi:hypothetical protein